MVRVLGGGLACGNYSRVEVTTAGVNFYIRRIANPIAQPHNYYLFLNSFTIF
jgi:hypothetical protein